MFSASELSAQIRARKKKIKEAPVGIVDTSPVPDMNAQDAWDLEKKGQYEDTIDSPPKINADETAMDEPYVQEPMSKENMKSHVQPKEHGKMAYGGMRDAHMDPMMPSKEMAEEVAGSSMTRSEMARRTGEGFSSGSKHMPSMEMPSYAAESEIGGVSDVEGEMKRRTMMRKQRLSSYLDSMDDF